MSIKVGHSAMSIVSLSLKLMAIKFGHSAMSIVSLSLLANNNWTHNFWLHSLLLNNGNAFNLL